MKEVPNLKYIKELAGDDKAFEQKFIDIVKLEFPEEKQEYINCYTGNKYLSTAEIVHKLKHKFNILGMHEGYRLAVTYEEELKLENTNLHTSFLRVLETIEAYIKDLKA